MRIVLSHRLARAALAPALSILVFVGCSEMTQPTGGDAAPRSLQTMTDRARAHLTEGLPASLPEGVDPGELHNDILAAFEALHRVQDPLSRERFTQIYIQAAHKALAKHGVEYTVSPGLVGSFLDLFDAGYETYGLNAPGGLLRDMHAEGMLTGGERKALGRMVMGLAAQGEEPTVCFGRVIREASVQYWRDTGRIRDLPGPGAEGWLKDLFTVGADTVGGVLGGLAGAGAGTIVGGPAGGTVGGIIGGSLGAGAFSSVAIMTLECACREN